MTADRSAVKTSWTKMDTDMLQRQGKVLVLETAEGIVKVDALTVDGGALFASVGTETRVYSVANGATIRILAAGDVEETKSAEQHVEHMVKTMEENGVSNRVPVSEFLR